MLQSKETNLGKDRIGSLFFALAVPAITSQVVNALYNMVDRMYIGHIPGSGAAALTGLSQHGRRAAGLDHDGQR